MLECVQVLEDTELYQVRRAEDGRTAALKIERPAGAARKGPWSGRRPCWPIWTAPSRPACSPRMPRQRTRRPAAGISPWSGARASTPPRPRPSCGRPAHREDLLALAAAVARAYARLHERGVVHGDVHPRNVLVTAAGEAVLLDFG